jgi:F0F1-type ATP synthase assembly protein I
MVMLGELFILFGGMVAAILTFRHPERLNDRPKDMAVLLSFCFLATALSGLTQLLIPANNQDQQTLLRLMINLRDFIAIPLIASILLMYAFGKTFSRAAWGRWALVLFAMFELLRRNGSGEIYGETLHLISTACVLILAIKAFQKAITLPLFGAALCWCVSLNLLGSYAMINLTTQPWGLWLYSVLLGVSMVLISAGVNPIIRQLQSND